MGRHHHRLRGTLARPAALAAVAALGCGRITSDAAATGGTRAADAEDAGGGTGTTGSEGGSPVAELDPGDPPIPGTDHGAIEHGCGDGERVPGEECDDGNGRMGDGCNGVCEQEPSFACPEAGPCEPSNHCGDGAVETGEVCDDGNTTGGDGCSADCLTLEPSALCATPGVPHPVQCDCGDGQVARAEACDDGNVMSGDGCTADCTRIELGWRCPVPGTSCVAVETPPPAPGCGDGVVQEPETCDDGVNASEYGPTGCTPDCRVPPACGDGVRDEDWGEECDDGGLEPYDGCEPDCRVDPFFVCGDGVVQPQAGEECDLGTNLGGWDGCTPDCLLGPRCGDGVVQLGHELCDDGVNDGSYGRCAPGCALGPYCGDGVVQAGEECDGADDCSRVCRLRVL